MLKAVLRGQHVLFVVFLSLSDACAAGCTVLHGPPACCFNQAKASAAAEKKKLADELRLERAGRERAEELLVRQVRCSVKM